MKKQKPFSLETQEEKEARWAKNLKAAPPWIVYAARVMSPAQGNSSVSF